MVEASVTENLLVKIENLDKLLSLAGEVIISSSNLGNTYKNLQVLFDSGKPVNRDTLDLVGDLSTTTADISSELHHLVQSIRTVDLKDLSFRTRRLVRDISRKIGRRVEFEFEGELTSVDKTIVEALYDPISHQLRNAIDHGIEDTHVRLKNGKPEEGNIVLRAYNSESETFIEIEDDGAGIDLEQLKRKGIESGKLSKTDVMDEEKALDIMCAAGVSTAKEVSAVSGRGVGMDVVRAALIDLGGSLSFVTEKGKGTTFTFRVPLVSAVNIVDALVVRSGKHHYAFPISSVAATMSIPKKEFHSTMQKGEMVNYLDRLLPAKCLNELLDGERLDYDDENVSVLVVENKGNWLALKISEFFSPQKLVIIPFNGAIDVEGLSGTTILGGRNLGFIVDTNSLIARSTGFGRKHELSKEQGKGAGKKWEKVKTVSELETAIKEGRENAPEKDVDETPKTVVEEQAEEAVPVEQTQEFIVEIEKMLPQLNEAIFDLEKNAGDMDKINLAFRLFHTIKGNLIMIGYAKGGDTVHSVESVLDYVRGNKLDVSPEMMDVIMDGVSYIEDVVIQSKAGEHQDIASLQILEASAKILPEKKVQMKRIGDVAAAEIEFTHEASYRAVNYRKRKTPFYQCYIEFDSGRQPPFLVACLIFKRISEIGDVLGTVPPMVDIENGIMEDKFRVFFVSEVEYEKLEKALVSVLTEHYGAKTVKLKVFG
jgi:chemotaxis protein histidine kinase CheA